MAYSKATLDDTVTVQVRELQVKLSTAETTAAEKQAAASRAAERAEAQEAAAADLLRDLKQTKQDAAQMQEALERELETTGRLVSASLSPAAFGQADVAVGTCADRSAKAQHVDLLSKSSMVCLDFCGDVQVELHKGTADDRSKKVEELNNMVEEFSQRYQVARVLQTAIWTDLIPIHLSSLFRMHWRICPASHALCSSHAIVEQQEVQVTSQEAIEKLEAAKKLAEEEAAAERASRERMLAAVTAGEVPGLRRAATAAAEGALLCTRLLA